MMPWYVVKRLTSKAQAARPPRSELTTPEGRTEMLDVYMFLSSSCLLGKHNVHLEYGACSEYSYSRRADTLDDQRMKITLRRATFECTR